MDMRKKWTDQGKRGFSLVEVNLAILMATVGVLTLLTLFPYGLKENEMGVADTHEAMFVSHVFSCIEGRAQGITNWHNWSDLEAFTTNVAAGVYPLSDYVEAWALGGFADTESVINSGDEVTIQRGEDTDVGEAVTFPDVSDIPDSEDLPVRKMRFQLTIRGTGRVKELYLRAKSGKFGKWGRHYKYYTRLMYMGM